MFSDGGHTSPGEQSGSSEDGVVRELKEDCAAESERDHPRPPPQPAFL